ncbi:glycosyltransferase family 32 protein [Paucibacter sp. Y2R2-4]|uniref:glycosyltransferase family 32 protein n=1 Tax=Paucibacter sp. Y2R2-4 TaxID=2893553 RepID=UPI0021E3A4DE|nr:glycosyltransferase [Paucibacter sp. Y2R2-4]MCV2349267.1 hypothetical protein [Paucibacter sp. Y2R2-4]
MAILIPRVFHQIWINSKNPELPSEYAAYRDSWLRLHPGWEYKLWNLDNLDFTPQRQELLRMAGSYAQMADILRYEILFRHGGVYLDTDFECRKNIDGIMSGVKNFACSEDGSSVTNAIIGAIPGSVYMQRCIQSMPKQVGLTSPTIETGPGFLTKVLLGQGIASDFTLYPTAWFYPYGWNETHRSAQEFPEAYAIHRWAHSWGDGERGLLLRIKRKLRTLSGK